MKYYHGKTKLSWFYSGSFTNPLTDMHSTMDLSWSRDCYEVCGSFAEYNSWNKSEGRESHSPQGSQVMSGPKSGLAAWNSICNWNELKLRTVGMSTELSSAALHHREGSCWLPRCRHTAALTAFPPQPVPPVWVQAWLVPAASVITKVWRACIAYCSLHPINNSNSIKINTYHNS